MSETSRRVVLFLLLLIGAFAGRTLCVAQTSGRIEAIKKICQKTNEDIARSEESPEISTIFLTELAVNRNNGPYPAVGIYRTVVKFYYTFGDREKEPYPNRLLKIIVATDRSDRKEHSEFVFNEAAQVIFYLEKKDNIERRLYLAAEKPIRLEQDDRLLSLKTRSQAAIVATIMKEKANLVQVFRRSLGF
jgi:hypothetical protein